jgi:hypothetical protein
MKITVDLPESELAEICHLTGIHKKGPAIRKLLGEILQAKRRANIAGKFLTGEWFAELSGFEASKAADRAESTTLSEQWRG